VSSGETPLRPLPISELLDETFRLYRRHFSLLAGISLAVSVPTLLIYLVLAVGLGTLSTGAATPDQLQQALVGIVVPVAMVGLLALLVVPFTVGGLVRATVELALGRPASLGSVVRSALGSYFPLWGVFFLYGVVGVALFIPILTWPVLVWIMIRWSVAVPALLCEGVGPARALGRSWKLVRGQWWRTLGILVVVSLMVAIVGAGVGYLFGAIAALVPGLSSRAQFGVQQMASGLANVVVQPISYIAWTLLYFDLRVRQEAFDLEQLARLTGPPSPEPA